MRPMAVDLPAPFGPSRATVSPAAIDRSRPSSASDVAEPARHAVELDGGARRPAVGCGRRR